VAAGAVLTLNIGVLQIDSSGCAPIKDAVVDLWHCDALGVYSDVAQEGTVGRKFPRGHHRARRPQWTTSAQAVSRWRAAVVRSRARARWEVEPGVAL
jgi:protocatechuate 3,4-dioxygenase beta subunit